MKLDIKANSPKNNEIYDIGNNQSHLNEMKSIIYGPCKSRKKSENYKA